MAPKIKGKKTLSVEVPADLYAIFSKLCIDNEVTKTEAIIRYMKYLKKRIPQERRLIDGKTQSNPIDLADTEFNEFYDPNDNFQK